MENNNRLRFIIFAPAAKLSIFGQRILGEHRFPPFQEIFNQIVVLYFCIESTNSSSHGYKLILPKNQGYLATIKLYGWMQNAYYRAMHIVLQSAVLLC